MPADEDEFRPDRIWDPLVRFLHWTLVASIAAAWFTDEATLRWHELAGYLASCVVALRVIWGFAGRSHARFRSFVRRPDEVRRYVDALRAGREPRYLGHNPLGGWMVLALLVVVAATCVTGWMYTLDAFWGLAWLDALHRTLAWSVVVFAGVHVAGVLFTSVRHRENLIAAMWSGNKRAARGDDRR